MQFDDWGRVLMMNALKQQKREVIEIITTWGRDDSSKQQKREVIDIVNNLGKGRLNL